MQTRRIALNTSLIESKNNRNALLGLYTLDCVCRVF
jgi:hypothetical protein